MSLCDLGASNIDYDNADLQREREAPLPGMPKTEDGKKKMDVWRHSSNLKRRNCEVDVVKYMPSKYWTCCFI